MKWQLSLISWPLLMSGPLSRPVLADVQTGNYHLTVTTKNGVADSMNHGPLQQVLPQMNETQQWCLMVIGLLGLVLGMLLIKIWWRNRQSIKEQPK